MFQVPRKLYKTIVILYLQAVSTFAMPFLHPVIQAQPQIMMHTLQQPIPMKTIESHLKTQSLEKPTFLQGMQTMQGMQNLQELQSLQGIPDPLLMPAMQQMQENMEQQIALQQQMIALQQLQGLNVQSPMNWPLPQQQPVMILLPEEKTNSAENYLFKNTDLKLKDKHEPQDQGYEDEELDSVVIEEPSNSNVKQGMRKAILLIPNAKFSIGGLISTIPWLPIEINVPDSIAWAWNGITSGISGIISIIGNRLPFVSRPPESSNVDPSVKMFLQQLPMKNIPSMPIYVMPMAGAWPVQNY